MMTTSALHLALLLIIYLWQSIKLLFVRTRTRPCPCRGRDCARSSRAGRASRDPLATCKSS